jgi:hypothetical protein
MTVHTHSQNTDTEVTDPTDALDTGPITAPAQEPACPACAHPLAQHDTIGARFCQATLAGSLSRGCVCRTS